MTIAAEEITGVVLAGGRGTRMGHVDKGLQLLRGYPMVMHVIARLAPQVGPILLNANRNQEVYATLGHEVVADRIGPDAGPLAGVHAGFLRCQTPYLLCVPCDSPLLPTDLAERLAKGLVHASSEVAMAYALGRAQPVFSLMRVEARASLEAFLLGGGRKFEQWTERLHCVAVAFDDEPDAFLNLNTEGELRARELAASPEKPEQRDA